MPSKSKNPYSPPAIPDKESKAGRLYNSSSTFRVTAFLLSLYSGYIALNVLLAFLHAFLYTWERDTPNIIQLLPVILLISGAIALGFLAFYWMAFALMKNQPVAKLRYVALTTTLILIGGILTLGW